MQDIYIVKASGEREVFDESKLRQSLSRTHVSEEVVENVLREVRAGLKDGMSTKEIYIHAFDLLEKEHKPAAVRYSLRNAIGELGPTGFPFEQLIAAIFQAKGFETKTDFVATGECVDHEIDIVAWNKEKLIMCEAKFHNEFGLKSDIKVALYVKARWDDLDDKEFEGFGSKRKLNEGWLITNTKFSEQAIKFAKCRNMKLVGWNYPENGSLQDLIEETGLHPITSLRCLNSHEKKVLMESGVIHIRQALENQDILKQAGIADEKIAKIVEEINLIQK